MTITRKHGIGFLHLERSNKRDGYGVTYTEPGKKGILYVGWVWKKGTKWLGISNWALRIPRRGASSVIKAARKMHAEGVVTGQWAEHKGELMTVGSARLKEACDLLRKKTSPHSSDG